MFWNEIRDHIRERLPAIVDFVLFALALTVIAVVLLGLSWLYVEYGGALFGVAVALVCLLGLLSGLRAPVYSDDGKVFRLGGDPQLPPPGKQALPPPASRRSAGRTKRSRSIDRRCRKGALKRQEILSKDWRVTPTMIAACDAARGRIARLSAPQAGL